MGPISHPEATRYLERRGLYHPAIIEELGISYAPAGTCGATSLAGAYQFDLLLDTGLIKRQGRDAFCQRVISTWPARCCSLPVKALYSSRAGRCGWMAGCSLIRFGLIPRARDFSPSHLRMHLFALHLLAGFGARRFLPRPRGHSRGVGVQWTPVEKLHPAVAAVVQVSARQLLQQIREASLHGIDFVRHFQLHHPEGAALRAPAGAAEMIRIMPGNQNFALALPAVVDRQILKPFPEGPVDAPQLPAALSAFPHCSHCISQLH